MKRRANTEGSITRLTDGRWQARVSLPDGKRRASYGRTRQEALLKLQSALRSVQDGLTLGSERLTIGRWLEIWLEDNAARRVRPRTLQVYRDVIRLHLAPRLGHIRLTRLTRSDVQRALNEAFDAGQAPGSVAKHRAVLRAALNTAIREGFVARNAAALADPPHAPEAEREPLTSNRARAIMAAVRGDRLEALYLLLLATGLRAGEALGLRWADVDLDHGSVNVQRGLHRVGGAWLFLEPKTRRSRRTISLPAQLGAALRAHQVRQLKERLQVGAAWQGEQWGNLVFTGEDGGPLWRDHAYRRFRKLLKRADLPLMRLHDLRHGAVSMMAALGVPPRVAMEIMGHSQIATTMNTYAHIAPEWQKEAMETVARGLWAEA